MKPPSKAEIKAGKTEMKSMKEIFGLWVDNYNRDGYIMELKNRIRELEMELAKYKKSPRTLKRGPLT